MELIAAEGYGRMVTLKGQNVTDVEISTAIAQLNLVDPNGELVRTAEALGVSFGR